MPVWVMPVYWRVLYTEYSGLPLTPVLAEQPCRVWYTDVVYKYGILEVYMNTARERYEAKTKVVTFRVSNEVFDQIGEVKARSGLSNADLIKLGAGIAQEEIKAKLAEASGLANRLTRLKAAVRQTRQELERALVEERKRRLDELDTEIEAFKLFDGGWALEEVSFKTGIAHEITYRYFQEWGEARNNKKAVKREVLRECLRKHLDVLKERRSWCHLIPSYSKDLEGVQKEIDYCQYLLQAPSKINDDRKAFLLAEYSRQIQPAKTKGKLDEST